MKNLKIGRSSANDIILTDSTVSSIHASITVSSTGEVTIKDLNSSNGTFVNGKRITAPMVLKSTDVVRLGNYAFDWSKKIVPHQHTVVNKESGYVPGDAVDRKTIGRSPGNNIVLNYDDVSSSHASLVKKSNAEVYIVDNGSTNGTYVNGRKITSQKLVKGDIVLISNKHKLQWEIIFGTGPKSHNVKWLPIIGGIAAVVLLGFILWKGVFLSRDWKPEQLYSHYEKSIVYIYGQYYYEIKAKDRTLMSVVIDSDGDLAPLNNQNPPMEYSGTGFFISRDGKIATNRHVVMPGVGSEELMAKIKEYYQKLLADLSLTNKQAFLEFQPLISEIKVTCELVDIRVALNDSYLTGWDQMIPCKVIRESGDDKIDIGILQVYNKSLPSEVTNIVDLSNIDPEIKVGKTVYSIGFPRGTTLALTEQGLKANNQKGEITQIRDEASFGHNITILQGASGSPVFNSRGQLIGVVHAGFLGLSQGYNLAIKAKHLVDLANK